MEGFKEAESIGFSNHLNMGCLVKGKMSRMTSSFLETRKLDAGSHFAIIFKLAHPRSSYPGGLSFYFSEQESRSRIVAF